MRNKLDFYVYQSRKTGVPVANTAHYFYAESAIAKGETNDCVVRAFASAFDISYDEAHDFCRLKLGRKNGHGTQGTLQLLSSGEAFGRKVEQLGEPYPGVTKTPASTRLFTKYRNRDHWGNMETTYRDMTVGTFLKRYTKGTYILRVNAHMFTVKDGVVYGNPQDAQQLRTRIIHAFQVK